MSTSNSKNNVYTFEAFSKYQPIDIKPVFGRNWVLNGVNNTNFQIYRDAYDDSPTNASIINSYASYIFGEGIVGIDKYLSIDDQELATKDLYKYGGCTLQVIWNIEDSPNPLKMEYLPVYKFGVNYDAVNVKVNGYWYSYDWVNRFRYKPQLYPIFTGKYKGNPLEIIYIRRPTEEPFFPVPDYLSGIPWAQIEGEIANTGINKYRNGMEDITIINSNNGMIADPDEAKKDADEIRAKVVGSENAGKVVVSLNEAMENALTVDRVAPPEFAQHNVFYSEEAERKLIVAHSAPPVIFAGSNSGNGFSSNADEREVALQDLYRMKINPYRRTFISGILPFFKAIGIDTLEFKDFETNEEIQNDDTSVVALDEKTLDAQAQLKGSVGGVQSLLEIQSSYAQGLTTYDSAINMLDVIFGYNKETAIRLLGKPKLETTDETTT